MVIAKAAVGSLVNVRVRGSLAGMHQEWDDLLATSEYSSVFQTYAWVSEWWQVYGWIRRLRIIEVRDSSGLLVGLAPLMVEPPRRLGGPRTLTFVGSWASGQHHILSRPGWTNLVCRVVCDFAGGSGGWESTRLLEIPAPWHELLNDALHDLGRSGSFVEVENEDPVIDLAGGWKEVLARLARDDRHELMRKLRRWESTSGTRTIVASNSGDLGGAMRMLLKLNRRRWGRQGLHSTNPISYWRRRLFLERVVRKLAPEGRVRIHVAAVDGQPAAAVLCFDHADVCYAYLAGYDPAFSRLSPGIVTFARSVEAAAERGCTEFNFICGEHNYKYRLGARNRPLYCWVLPA